MDIIVPIKFAPDLVEELEIDASGAALDRTFLRLIINEFDDHAIEQAILLTTLHYRLTTAVKLFQQVVSALPPTFG